MPRTQDTARPNNAPDALASVAVMCDPPGGDRRLRDAAARLADQLNLPQVDPRHSDATPADNYDALLTLTPARLELRWLGPTPPSSDTLSPIAVDLRSIDGLSPQGRSLRQPIARAVGLRKGEPWRPRVLDATAGFGEDAWLLASLGCPVIAVERSPVMAALLDDALRRAAQTKPQIADRITLVHADAADLLRDWPDAGLGKPPDVIYLDPMFPARQRKAAERKHMWVLRRLVGSDLDAAALFDAAARVAARRVVVKRPRHPGAPPLAPDPAATHQGKAHRYDVYSTR